jgi:small subunit ribosomal protein S16
MSVVIRMKRAGAKKRPFYRVVVADSRFARDGRYIEQLGYYDPLTDPAKFVIDTGKFEQWILRGARPSESVEVMMAKHSPASLRPVRIPAETHALPEALAPAPKEKKTTKAKAVKKAAAKTPRKPRTATKADEKKAKTKAKAKARKKSGTKAPAKAKKAKKSKK